MQTARRTFMAACVAAGVKWATVRPTFAAGSDRTAFFTTARRGDRWWFITPAGQPFFSLGMNHLDSATLRYPENAALWREKYGNSQERWLREGVARDLRDWGFNCVGWVQEVVTRTPTNHRHSRNFTFEEYQWLDLPYCHMLPFADFHQWDAEVRHPNLRSKDFEEWCDYVARAECTRMAADPKLIGYFYLDCPTWVHTTRFSEWKGPLFDPQRLETPGGRRELFDLATRYYQVTHDAVRRYDRRHLILGDRYEAKAALPDEVLLAAKPYVDVISVQHFGRPAEVTANLQKWSELTGLPTLLADAAPAARKPGDPPARWGQGYRDMLVALQQTPACIGWHVCGAYLRNRVRGFGFRDEQEQGDEVFLNAVRDAHRANAAWVRQAAAQSVPR